MFGIHEQGGWVYTRMITDCGQATPMPIIRRKVVLAGMMYCDSWGGYDTRRSRGIRTSG